VLATATPAAAQDTAAPVLNTATRSPATDGNGHWYRKTPVTVTLAATDDVGVTQAANQEFCKNDRDGAGGHAAPDAARDARRSDSRHPDGVARQPPEKKTSGCP
jgi:hypothetical protein